VWPGPVSETHSSWIVVCVGSSAQGMSGLSSPSGLSVSGSESCAMSGLASLRGPPSVGLESMGGYLSFELQAARSVRLMRVRVVRMVMIVVVIVWCLGWICQ